MTGGERTAARAELVDAFALLGRLHEVGAMGQGYLTSVQPAMLVAHTRVKAAVAAWLVVEAKS
jgi:hypothetical protein